MPVAAKAGNTVTFRNTAAHRHKGHYDRDVDDFYVEPRWCIEALLDYETFIGNIWDPCCGSGNIVEAAEARGFSAGGSDIRQRYENQHMVADFLDDSRPKRFERLDNIITNPPFRKGLILPIIEKAIAVARHKVAVLVPAPFLFSLERYEFFERHRPKLILFFSSRPSMPPGDMLKDGIIKATGGKEDYAFVTWARDHRGQTTCDWILSADAARKREQKQARAAARAGQD